MNHNNWWTGDDLPPPSMRVKYKHALVQRFLPSSRLSQQNRQSDEKDKILEQRLTNLNMNKSEDEIETLASLEERAKMLKMHNGNQDTPSVSDIEERLAKLRDVPVESIGNSRFAVVNGDETEEETVEKLMRRAKDEAMLETMCDRSGKSGKHNVDPEEFIRICRNDASFPDGISIYIFQYYFSFNKLAESLLGTVIYLYFKIVLEAEKAENEAIQIIKDSKKNGKKSGIFSRIFRSQ
ncbi:unnamed protein product [Onchocerca flexuosa]|uniref:Uncharacterized protein n=1 Tax=Onchocerca flexuosa TaxID=387005 RepID=A0A183I1M3_9BILA|nr:unnamed protein product [Onchocerca flexuosa]